MNSNAALQAARQAATAGQLSQSALENLTCWLTQERYRDYVPAIKQHIDDGQWQVLDDVFWTVIPFGTGGRRGRMYEFGSNAINERTIGESAQGLASYVVELGSGDRPLRCAIAYDTRHRSREFAELCAGIMVANGLEVYFLDEYRATPQLSFAVRYFQCDCGIMVTASHNPPSDNAVKIYWSTGGQVLPPHDNEIISRVMSVEQIQQVDFASALAEGKIRVCTADVDQAFLAEVTQYAWPGPREANLMYSPLHGVGSSAVLPALSKAGFANVGVYQPHAQPSGDFPNVPGHVSNPENAAVFDAIIEDVRGDGVDAILATDPDCDRLGVAAPLETSQQAAWETLNGNQIGALLTDFVCRKMRDQEKLTKRSYIIKTLVTSELSRRIAESYSVRCEGNLHVGFKWIAGTIDEVGPDDFVFGTEESHGYLIGQYCRDKDGVAACSLMSQLVAELKAQGRTLHQRLDELLIEHGCHTESLITLQMEGSEGMLQMQQLMQAFRESPPASLGGLDVIARRDYQSLTCRHSDGSSTSLQAPAANMVMLDLSEPGNYFAVRPSGTEPKVKFYMFTYLPSEKSQDLPVAKATLAERLKVLERDIRSFADQFA